MSRRNSRDKPRRWTINDGHLAERQPAGELRAFVLIELKRSCGRVVSLLGTAAGCGTLDANEGVDEPRAGRLGIGLLGDKSGSRGDCAVRGEIKHGGRGQRAFVELFNGEACGTVGRHGSSLWVSVGRLGEPGGVNMTGVP